MAALAWQWPSCSACTRDAVGTYLCAARHDDRRCGVFRVAAQPGAARAARSLHRHRVRDRAGAGVPGAGEEPFGARASQGDAGRRAVHRATRGTWLGTAIVYAIDRRRALRCCGSRSSRSPTTSRRARARGRNVFLWDFLFYALVRRGRDVVGADRGRAARIRLAGDSGGRRTLGVATASHRALAVGWTFAFVASLAGLGFGALRFPRRTQRSGRAHGAAHHLRASRCAVAAPADRMRHHPRFAWAKSQSRRCSTTAST